jgi:hypothetical protein
LKGLTGNLGAHALYEKIADIDRQLKQGSLPDAGMLDDAQELLQKIMNEIDNLASDTRTSPPGSASKPLSPADLHTLLVRLEKALEYDLGATEPLLTALRAGVSGTPLASEIAAIASLIDTFDIDAALAKLRKLEGLQPGKTP